MWEPTSKTRDASLSFSHRRLAVIKTQCVEKTWYQISDRVTGAKQVHNVAACGDSKEKKWMQSKVPPHGQEVCRERCPLGDTGSWGYALQTCSQPAGKICLQTGGTAAKAEMCEQPGSSVNFHWPASPFLPLLSLHTITASLSLHLLELLSPLSWSPPCYSFFPYLSSCFISLK